MTRKSFFNMLLGSPLAATCSTAQAATPACTGILVSMSDGTQKTAPLGYGLVVKNGALQTQLPVQYVNIAAVYSAPGVWIYDKCGRNVEVWLNGLLMRAGSDYRLDPANRMITPLSGVWMPQDTVTVAYLY